MRLGNITDLSRGSEPCRLCRTSLREKCRKENTENPRNTNIVTHIPQTKSEKTQLDQYKIEEGYCPAEWANDWDATIVAEPWSKSTTGFPNDVTPPIIQAASVSGLQFSEIPTEPRTADRERKTFRRRRLLSWIDGNNWSRSHFHGVKMDKGVRVKTCICKTAVKFGVFLRRMTRILHTIFSVDKLNFSRRNYLQGKTLSVALIYKDKVISNL